MENKANYKIPDSKEAKYNIFLILLNNTDYNVSLRKIRNNNYAAVH